MYECRYTNETPSPLVSFKQTVDNDRLNAAIVESTMSLVAVIAIKFKENK